MKKRKKIIIASIVLSIIVVAILLIYKYDKFTLEILEITNNKILARSTQNNRYYLVYIPDDINMTTKNFYKINISDLKEGNIIYVLNKPQEIKNAIAIVTSEGYSIEEILNNVKLIRLLK